MTDYPEHVKLKEVQGDSQTIGKFLDWTMNGKGWDLCIFNEDAQACDECEDGAYLPIRATIQNVLAEYFSIDPNALEAEKVAMLESLRAGG